jgi:hypothetical protein
VPYDLFFLDGDQGCDHAVGLTKNFNRISLPVTGASTG